MAFTAPDGSKSSFCTRRTFFLYQERNFQNVSKSILNGLVWLRVQIKSKGETSEERWPGRKWSKQGHGIFPLLKFLIWFFLQTHLRSSTCSSWRTWKLLSTKQVCNSCWSRKRWVSLFNISKQNYQTLKFLGCGEECWRWELCAFTAVLLRLNNCQGILLQTHFLCA